MLLHHQLVKVLVVYQNDYSRIFRDKRISEGFLYSIYIPWFSSFWFVQFSTCFIFSFVILFLVKILFSSSKLYVLFFCLWFKCISILTEKNKEYIHISIVRKFIIWVGWPYGPWLLTFEINFLAYVIKQN